MIKNKLFNTLLLALFASPVMASDLSGEGELGFTSTAGNSDSETLNAKIGLGKAHGDWQHNAKLEVLQSTNNGIDSADLVVFTEKSEYRFAEKTFAFASLRYEQDKFSGFDHQAILSLGMGHKILEGVKHELEASAGAGYRDIEDNASVTTREVVFDGSMKYAWKISETSTFNQNLFVESGSSNTYSKSETFLKLVVVGNLGAKFGYEIKHNSKAPAGTEKTDTITTATLVYSF